MKRSSSGADQAVINPNATTRLREKVWPSASPHLMLIIILLLFEEELIVHEIQRLYI
jgi:hypothetical protein